MNIFELHDWWIRDYASDVRSFICIRHAQIPNEVERNLDEAILWPDPLVQLNPAFALAGGGDGLYSSFDGQGERLKHP